MSNELEKGKKKIDDLNFKKNKRFSFEDFRDTKILYDDKKKNYNNDDSKTKDTLYTTINENTFENEDEIINNKDNTFESNSEKDNF